MEENEVEKKEVEVVEPIKNEEVASEPEKESKGLSIASLVLGLIGLLVAAIPCGTLAIIFGLMGKKKGGAGMATAGFILGIADVAFGIIYAIITMFATSAMLMNL